MHPQKLWTDDDGSAALEFVALGTLLLVPLVYLVIALAVIQTQTLGAESAARHIARTIASASSSASSIAFIDPCCKVSVATGPSGRVRREPPASRAGLGR